MLGSLSWEHMLVLVVVGLVVLGPERLPGAIRWTSNALRQARDYLSGVTTQLREDLGPEFDDLRVPLSELQKLRGMTPRAALTKHLLDGDDSFLTGAFDRPVNGAGAGGGWAAPPRPDAVRRRRHLNRQRRVGSSPSDTPASPRRRDDRLSATARSALPTGESGALSTSGVPESPASTSAGSSGI